MLENPSIRTQVRKDALMQGTAVSSWSRSSTLNGVLHQFARVPKPELLFQVSLVGLDGLHAEMQLFGDLPGPVPFANQPKHFELAVGQIVHGERC